MFGDPFGPGIRLNQGGRWLTVLFNGASPGRVTNNDGMAHDRALSVTKGTVEIGIEHDRYRQMLEGL